MGFILVDYFIFVVKFLNIQKSTEFNKHLYVTKANILSYAPWMFKKEIEHYK